MHPVDMITGYVAFALTAGVFNGIYSWAGPGEPDPITIPGTVAIMLLFRFTNVYKHSHIWVSYGRIISHLISTPAQHQVHHQVHHSIEQRHLDRNFGRAFAIWDWMFGTLYLADRREEFEMGLLDEEHLDYQSVSACYLVPFVKAARIAGLSKE